MSNLVSNERVKLAASFFNNAGVAALSVGAFIPLFAIRENALPIVVSAFGIGIVCFCIAQWRIGSLRE